MIAYALLDCVQLQISGLSITSDYPNLEKKLADLSLKVDELIYFKNKNIEQVFVVRDNLLESFKECRQNSIYFTSNNVNGSFYCTPDVLAQISSLYKINFSEKFSEKKFNEYFKTNQQTVLTNKLMYIIDRLGIDIYVR